MGSIKSDSKQWKWKMRCEEDGRSNGEGVMKRGKAGKEWIKGVTARQRIKKKAAFQLEGRVQTTLSRVCDRYRLPWCLSRRQTPTARLIFPLKLCPRPAGFLCKAGCQLTDVPLASSTTWISSSLPLGARVSAFNPEKADKCKPVLSLVSNKAWKMSRDLLKSRFSCCLQAVCGVCWAGKRGEPLQRNPQFKGNRQQHNSQITTVTDCYLKTNLYIFDSPWAAATANAAQKPSKEAGSLQRELMKGHAVHAEWDRFPSPIEVLNDLPLHALEITFRLKNGFVLLKLLTGQSMKN